jgi:probable HAF family extracellular repeat protein
MKPLLCGLVALGLLAAAGQAKADHLFTTIDVPGSTSTTLAGINNLGQIVGTSSAGSFLLSAGNFTTLNVPGTPSGINDSGQIVGNIFKVGYLYSGGSYVTLSVAPAGITVARGINNAGEVVGYWYDRVKNHGFLYSGGTYTVIGPNEVLGANDVATSINNVGQITICHGTTSQGARKTAAVSDALGGKKLLSVEDRSFR